MKVVFGGAFNPVTNAHIKLYEHIMKNLDVTEFIFLPVSNAYTKSELVSNYHRLAMLKLALKDYPDVDICEMEMDDSNFLGTYQSLIRIADNYDDDVAFVVGADNLINMDNKTIVRKYFTKYFPSEYIRQDDDEFKALVRILNKKDKSFHIISY